MSNDAIYLVVKETGEYSDWTKDNIVFYTTYEAAKTFVDLQETLHALSSDDCLRQCVYSIEVIQPGEPNNKFAELIAAASKERDRINQEKEVTEQARLNEINATLDAATTNDMREVYEFLLWWEGGIKKDSQFYHKIPARTRWIAKPIINYIATTGDKRAAEWVSSNKHHIY